jgi:hypothetical protein
MAKFTLFLAFSCIILMTSCQISKKINKAKNESQKETEVDSSGVEKKDVITDSKIVTETTELVDSTAFISPAGKLITDLKEVTKESIAVPIKKKKTTKRTEDVKETDKSQVKTEIKREEKKEENVVTKDADIKKSSLLPIWLWILIFIVLLALAAWKFRKKILGYFP